MIKITTEASGLVAGQPEGGADFYWEPGTHIVLVQEWEQKASGRVWSQAFPDPMWGNDFREYVKTCWDCYKVVDVNECFR